jgi:hypothetical protein
MHADDVMATDMLKEWQKDPANKEVSVKGDDRSPPWTWQLSIYSDEDGFIAMPSDNLMATLRKAGSRIPKPTGRGTLKELTQSSLLIPTEHCELLVKGKRVSMAEVTKLRNLSFKEQFDAVKKLNFELLVKRAKPPGSSSKHVRVRPLFRAWQVKGVIQVLEPAITAELLEQCFQQAGRFVGLADWRPGSPISPGPYGMFDAEVKPVAVLRAG